MVTEEEKGFLLKPMNDRDIGLLKKHYSMQQMALNEIAEMVSLQPWDEELIKRISDVCDEVRPYDLLNPYRTEIARKWVEDYPHQIPEPHL